MLEEQDVDIMAWAMRVAPVPERWQGPAFEMLARLDYVPIAR